MVDLSTKVSFALVPVAAVALFFSPAVVSAQSMTYKSAKAAGVIGEKPDGYLAVVNGGNADARRVVDSVNIKRKAKYTELASQKGVTVQEVALSTGCNLITKLQPGQKYMTPSGQWKSRDGSPPERDARCP
ncbi:MAG: YdbL family protein [Pseudomonadota bacterium]